MLASSSASYLGLNPRIFGLQGFVLPLTLFSLTLLEEAPPKVCHATAWSQLYARDLCSKDHIPGALFDQGKRNDSRTNALCKAF